MAKFNPDLPQSNANLRYPDLRYGDVRAGGISSPGADFPFQDKNAPQYFNWSRGISQPKFEGPTAPKDAPVAPAFADISGGKQLEAAGEIAGGAITSADDIIKTYAGEAARNAAYEQRDLETKRLRTAYSTVTGQSDQSQASLVASSPSDAAPQDLQQSLKGLTTLKGARASGKLSETDYYARVGSDLSDVRSRFPPAYRDYIDKQAESILGFNSANAYVRSLVGDINSYVENANARQKETRTRLERANDEGIPGMDEVLKDFNAGRRSEAEVNTKLNEAASKHYARKQAEDRVATYTADRKLQADKAGESYDQIARDAALDFYRDLYEKAGVTQDKANKTPISEADVEQRSVHIAQVDANYQREMNRKADILDPRFADQEHPNGRSYRMLAGAPAVNAAIESNRSLFKLEQDLIHNKDYGEAHGAQRLMAASQEDLALKIHNTPLGQMVERYKYVKNNLGDAAAQTAYGLMEKTGLPAELSKLMGVEKLEELSSDPKHPRTLADGYEAHAKFVKDPAFYQQLVHNVVGEDGLLAPLPSDKEQAAKAKLAKQAYMRSAFDPSNQRFIGIVSDRGQLPMSNLMTSKQVSDAVKEFGTQQNVKDYTNWMESSFKALYGRQVKSLNEIGVFESRNLEPTWNNTTHQWDLNVKDDNGNVVAKNVLNSNEVYAKDTTSAEPIGGKLRRQTGYANYHVAPQILGAARTQLRELNKAVGNIAYHYGQSSMSDTKVDSYLINTFRELGLDIESGKLGLGQQLIDTVMKSHGLSTQKQREEEKKKGEELSR